MEPTFQNLFPRICFRVPMRETRHRAGSESGHAVGASGTPGMRAGRLAAASVLPGLLLAADLWAGVELATSVDRVVRVTTAGDEIETMLLDAAGVRPGEELRYTVDFTNTSTEIIDPGIIVITNPIPEAVEYLEGTAVGNDTEVLFSVDGGASFAGPESLTVVEGGVRLPAEARHYTTIRWTYGGILGPGEGGSVAFDVRLKEEETPAEPVSDSAN